MGMTCPTCNGPLAYLFTSSYCPACDAREADKPAVYGPVQSMEHASSGYLFVGPDGELWWRKGDISWSITTRSPLGPIVAVRVINDGDTAILTRRATDGRAFAEAVDIRHLRLNGVVTFIVERV